MTLWTLNEARACGYRTDQQALTEITTWALGDMKTNSLSEQAPPRNVVNLGWVYVLLSMETAPGFRPVVPQTTQVAITGALASPRDLDVQSARQTLINQIVNKQAADGSWGQPLDERVPLGGPVEVIAILSRLALLQSGDRSAGVAVTIKKAGEWLAAHRESTSRQGRNLRLLMHICEGMPLAALRPVIDTILAEQNRDGGWSQTPDMPADAYATGQTLYVLARAGVEPDAPQMKRAVDFLKLTQLEDGSWPMVSRVHAKNLNPITATGTAWAVLGLLRASP